MKDRLLMVTFVTVFLLEKSLSLSDNTWWFSSEMSVIQKLYDDCAKNSQDLTYCLKNKAALAVERALARNISITDNLVLVRNEAESRSAKTENENQNLNPDQRIVRALSDLMKTHTFRVDLSDYETESSGRDFDERQGFDDFDGQREGGGGGGGGGGNKQKRKKKKRVQKVLPYLLMAKLAAMSIFGPMAVKILVLIAGKALIASKVALVISGMILLKKIFKSDHHESATFQVHTVPDHHRREIQAVYPDPNNNNIDPYRSYQPYQS